MAAINEKVKCFICTVQTPILDEHHIIPQFAGGQAGPTVHLCSTCHSGIHRQALNLLSKKAKRVQYFTEEQMQRAKPLVQQIVIALQQAKERRDPAHKVKVMMELSPDLTMILHMVKMDTGYKNLSSLCEAVLTAFARSRI